MKKRPYVSFCIPTYNRKEMIRELITHLLSCRSEELEVVVVDNYSDDGTIDILNQIEDKRLHIYREATKMDCGKSWYDALEYGKGDWIFHVLDRDWVDISKFNQLVNILHELEGQNVGFAVAGEGLDAERDYRLYQEGMETINEFGLRCSHPTGQIFYRKAWEEIANRKSFFIDERYGIYPHGYLYAIIGNQRKGAYILFDITDEAHSAERAMRTVSRFYETKSGKTEWFWPESRFSLLKLACENIGLVQDRTLYSTLIINKYLYFFFFVTKEWYSNCNNEILKLRYNCPELATNYIELMMNGFDYIALFREYLSNQKYWWADDVFYEKLCEVDKRLTEWLISWTNEIRKGM